MVCKPSKSECAYEIQAFGEDHGPSAYHPNCYATVTIMLLQEKDLSVKCEKCPEVLANPQCLLKHNNKDDKPLSLEETRALHDQATNLLSAIKSSHYYSVQGGWLVVFYFGLNVHVFC